MIKVRDDGGGGGLMRFTTQNPKWFAYCVWLFAISETLRRTSDISHASVKPYTSYILHIDLMCAFSCDIIYAFFECLTNYNHHHLQNTVKSSISLYKEVICIVKKCDVVVGVTNLM